MESTASRIVTAQCYCKSLHYTITLPESILPISAHMCHCSRCRYTHGTMCIFHVPLPSGIHPQFVSPSSLDRSVIRYWADGFDSDRRFCSTCGCHMGDYVESNDSWYLAPALFAKDESVFIIDEHIFTQSAPKGVWEWLPSIGERQLKITNPDNECALPIVPVPELGEEGEERLRAECYCRGVSFTVSRPTKENLRDEWIAKFVSPVDKTKWSALIDVDNDCRLISGVHINAWTFVPLNSCSPTIDRSFKHGTMKSYSSSPGVTRTFCGVCGATVFWSSENRVDRDDNPIVDLAVGVLKAPEGVRAENWLTWRTSELANLDAGSRYDADLFQSLQKGMNEWAEASHGKTLEFRIP
jgi:hypothetical protein